MKGSSEVVSHLGDRTWSYIIFISKNKDIKDSSVIGS